MLNNKRILLLGGAGFVGTALSKRLVKNGWDVTVLEKAKPVSGGINDVRYVYCDFFSDELFDVLDSFDKVVHLISTINPSSSMSDPIVGYQKDFVQTARIVDFLSKQGKTMYFASSGGTVYGIQDVARISEDMPTNPLNHYGMVKLLIENLLRMYNRTHNTKHISFRISNPYGPGQNSNVSGVGVIDAFVKRALTGDELVVYGDGEIVRDFIFIDDLTDALTRIIKKRSCNFDIYNIGFGEGHSLNHIINEINALLCVNISVNYVKERAVDIKRIVLDTTRFRHEYGENIIGTSISKGIEKTISFLRCAT